jgi:simple sugar transport system substrate-binding protein
LAKYISRRKFLGVSSTVAAVAAVGGLAVGAGGGYLVGSGLSPQQQTGGKRIKAGFVYVGPVGDYGYTYAHDVGRQYAVDHLPWLDTIKAESVLPDNTATTCDNLISQGADVVFTTSFDFMNGTVSAAQKHPDKFFAHCSGYKAGAAGNATQNMSAYFADFYQLYYLCGLAAGAVTQTGNIGYVAAHVIPEVVRHINGFVIGANEAYKARTGKNIKAYLQLISNWYDPAKATTAAQTLVDNNNCDVLAYTEDSPTVLQVAEDYTTKKGKKVWSFSHYSDMTKYGPNSHLTGQVVAWGPEYVEMLNMVYANAWHSIDTFARAGDYMPERWIAHDASAFTFDNAAPASGATDNRGATYLAPVNEAAIGSTTVALMKQRWNEMKELLFEPFTGPMQDMDGNTVLTAGQRANHDVLTNMMWFVQGVQNKISE